MDFKLYQGDCLTILEEMIQKGETVDVSFTSPPYNRKRNDNVYQGYDDTKEDYLGFLIDFTDKLLKLSKKWVIVNIQTNYYNKVDVHKYIGHYADKMQNIAVWVKPNPKPSGNKDGTSLMYGYENFFILGDNVIRTNGGFINNYVRAGVTANPYSKFHRATMNPRVCDWFIQNLTAKGDTVLDCFMGLGTTGISCKKMGRKFVGIELVDEYFKIAEERINNTNDTFDFF